MLEREKVLPIGSVVTLEGVPKGKFLITGYYPIAEGALYDYCAVSYPLGEKTSKAALMFQSDKIGSVLHRGYQNLAFDMLLDALDANAARLQDALAAGKLREGD
ncbi:MAG TPA: DUF4176 domain-containing protein [Candidatus Aphodomonas merdavium]|nr:DUF4176 domain-containing protein [Candidatus Aphodomonas merdavium]